MEDKMSLTYYPYLRGRQFELLALRELVEKELLSERVVPIIEPVRFSPTLIKTLKVFKEKHKGYALIQNPQYGNFREQVNKTKEIKKKFDDSISESKKINAYLIDEAIESSLMDISLDKTMLINKDMNCYTVFDHIIRNDVYPALTLIPDKRQFKKRVRKGKILLEDHFPSRIRNSDYAENDDEFFSDDHIGLESEGFIGFSDYSVIGSKYNETGFAPLAVAIHIVYLDKNHDLRVRHFVSDSNDDINDPAGKYGEAVNKMVKWCQAELVDKNQYTVGLNSLLETHKKRKYPGLGTIKKYSLMHHLELMNKYLEKS